MPIELLFRFLPFFSILGRFSDLRSIFFRFFDFWCVHMTENTTKTAFLAKMQNFSETSYITLKVSNIGYGPLFDSLGPLGPSLRAFLGQNRRNYT